MRKCNDIGTLHTLLYLNVLWHTYSPLIRTFSGLASSRSPPPFLLPGSLPLLVALPPLPLFLGGGGGAGHPFSKLVLHQTFKITTANLSDLSESCVATPSHSRGYSTRSISFCWAHIYTDAQFFYNGRCEGFLMGKRIC